jgi:hypothetical protein
MYGTRCHRCKRRGTVIKGSIVQFGVVAREYAKRNMKPNGIRAVGTVWDCLQCGWSKTVYYRGKGWNKGVHRTTG